MIDWDPVLRKVSYRLTRGYAKWKIMLAKMVVNLVFKLVDSDCDSSIRSAYC